MSHLSSIRRVIFGKSTAPAIIIGKLVALLDFFVPKDARLIVLGSNSTNAVTGSPKALLESIRKEHPSIKAFLLTKKPTNPGEIKANSLSSLRVFLRAKYLISSHGLSDFGLFRFSSRKRMLVTWHGIALKACGHVAKNLTKEGRKTLEEYVRATSACIASSTYDAAILSLMFGYAGGQMKITGRPRNDCLIGKKGQGKNKLREFIPNLSDETTVVLYAPTFRDEVMRRRGLFLRLFPFADMTEDSLEDFLKDEDVVILIRAHINTALVPISFESERIVDFSADVCQDVNDILSEVDIMMSDYSSIAYDFLLLDRPVLFVPYDIDDYLKYRGLIVDDYDFWTPGPKISTFGEFTKEIRSYIAGEPDAYQGRREDLRKTMHSHQTDNTTPRILRALFSLR